jgi:hypothetical protein
MMMMVLQDDGTSHNIYMYIYVYNVICGEDQKGSNNNSLMPSVTTLLP